MHWFALWILISIEAKQLNPIRNTDFADHDYPTDA
jgi:hypothetical protein